ncbi:GTP-binding protein-related [Zea mays]|uniref:GTP-binding protein-related n=1 Tax=Zea mays TaxID=4577 RepID=A0A1D6FIL5_MAIZE|nr:GTP-binding protein-related [Zea mays]
MVENGKAQAANFPFCTINPKVGVVAIPDPCLQVLSKLSKSQQTVPTSIELVYIVGLVKGARKGEGLGNQFLSNIREVDSVLRANTILHEVVRCFEDDDIFHVNGKVDPRSDIDVINLELIFSDLEQIEKRLDKLSKSKTKDTQVKVKDQALMEGKPTRSVNLAYLQSGMTAPQAAGVIHSDFQKGFIRVEAVSYDDFVAAGSLGVAWEKGLVHLTFSVLKHLVKKETFRKHPVKKFWQHFHFILIAVPP